MKFINKLAAICPVVVLTLGLISCSPEQKDEKDHFRIQEPEIITEKSKATRFSNLETNLVWNVEDHIRFQETDRSGLKISIRSSCKSVQTNEVFEAVQTQPLPKELSIGEILPVSLLARKNPISSNQFQCSFAFTAINSKGSQHKFHLQTRLLEEQPHNSRNTEIQINGSTIETKSNEWPTLLSADLEKFWVISPRADRFQLSCNDLKASLFSKTDLVSIVEIIKTLDANQLQTSIQRSPEQTCRILSYQNRVLQGWSRYFKITWVDSKLDIQVNRLLSSEYWSSTVVGTIHKLYEVHVKNPYSFPVYFSIPEQQQITTLLFYNSNSAYKTPMPFAIHFDRNTKGLILNGKNPYRLGLNAGAQIKLTLQTHINRIVPMQMAYAFPFHNQAIMQINRFENMTDDLQTGVQNLVPRQMIHMKGGHVSNFNPAVSEKYNPPGI